MGFRGKYRNKRDTEEPAIVEALRRLGCTVERLDKPVDLLVGYRGRTYAVEVKGPAGKLTKAQQVFFETWTGDVTILNSPDEAIEWVRGLR